jgi:predicted PurR-regulated permease PerM
VLSEFVRGQCAVVATMAVVYSAALHLLGVPHAPSIGVLAGILTLVPLLGVVAGALLAIGAAALLPGEAAPLWAIVAVFIGGNLLENFVVTPRLVGERIGLHPLTVIFALLVFGKLFGASGVLVALPATAVLQV